ncbi:hypothetical protein ACFVZH_20995 [Streptomyces sp. NPDC059534]|uniref:hypothetical protein n=1 Tax=Streptomyces sp. NPDC059534 TaxID=3346859 RepID=UPI0036B023B8
MPTPVDMLPPGPDVLMREIAALKRQMRELMASRRAETTTFGSGQLTVKTPSGTGLLTAGQDPVSERYQVAMRRDDGTVGLALSAQGPDESDTSAILTRSGQRILSDDPYADDWLGRPWIPVPMHASVAFTAGAWATTHMGLWLAQHRVLHLQAMLSAPVASTAQLRFTGTVGTDGAVSTLGPIATVSGGDTLIQYRATAADLGVVEYGDQITIRLEAQRTAGAGTCSAVCIGVWGSEAYTASET